MDSLPLLVRWKTRGGPVRRWTRSLLKGGDSPFTEREGISRASTCRSEDRRRVASGGAG